MSEQLDDHPDAHRHLWQAACYTLALFAINYGIGYAWHGNRYAVSPALDVLRQWPGGMHTHGVLMLALGAAMVAEAYHVDASRRHWVARCYCGYSAFISVNVVGAWWTTGQLVYAAPWAWVAFCALAAALIRYPPPSKKGATSA